MASLLTLMLLNLHPTPAVHIRLTANQLKASGNGVDDDMASDIAKAYSLRITGVPFLVYWMGEDTQPISVDAAVELLSYD